MGWCWVRIYPYIQVSWWYRRSKMREKGGKLHSNPVHLSESHFRLSSPKGISGFLRPQMAGQQSMIDGTSPVELEHLWVRLLLSREPACCRWSELWGPQTAITPTNDIFRGWRPHWIHWHWPTGLHFLRAAQWIRHATAAINENRGSVHPVPGSQGC